MCAPEYARLIELARKLRPGQRVVEIGTYGGTTLSLFALLADPGIEICAIDDFSNETEPDLRAFFEEHQKAVGTRSRINLFAESSHRASKRWSLPIDLLIIDGDHSYLGAQSDLADYAHYVVRGGTMIVDDYTSSSDVKKAVEEWLADPNVAALWERKAVWEMPEGKMIEFLRRGEGDADIPVDTSGDFDLGLYGDERALGEPGDGETEDSSGRRLGDRSGERGDDGEDEGPAR
jgi:predicted O-methyltransferase YrrM